MGAPEKRANPNLIFDRGLRGPLSWKKKKKGFQVPKTCSLQIELLVVWYGNVPDP